MRRSRARLAFMVAASALVGASGWVACASPYSENVVASLEGGSDAPAADGTDAGDGGEKGYGGESGADRGCESGTHSICDDFEGPFAVAWNQAIGAPGSLTASTEQAKSPTHALLVSIAGDAGSGQAYLKHPFAVVNTQGLTCDFELFVDTLPPAGSTSVSVLRFDMVANVDSEAAVMVGSLALQSDVTFISESAIDGDGGATQNAASSAALPVGSWAHFRVDVDLATREFSVKLDEKPLLDLRLTTTFTKNNGISISFGVVNDDKPTKYFVDDIACTVRGLAQ